MATYDATATREDGEWAITVDGVGTTRVGTLEEAGPMAVDMVVARLEVDPATVSVVVRTQLPEEIADAIEELQAAAETRDEDRLRYAEANLEAHRVLREYGISGRDTDAVLGALARPVE
jgi:hypothetical protein